MKKLIKIAKTINLTLLTYAAIASLAFASSANPPTSAADKISTSKIATGTKDLINDATNRMTGIAAAVGSLAIIYFAIRRSNADEQDQKRWGDRIKIAIISTIAAVVGSQIVNLIVGYYQ
jgi:heme/copper-type cytochrome/quinol oxidase subunit 2